jgi:hypothetical protein
MKKLITKFAGILLAFAVWVINNSREEKLKQTILLDDGIYEIKQVVVTNTNPSIDSGRQKNRIADEINESVRGYIKYSEASFKSPYSGPTITGHTGEILVLKKV